MNYYLVVSERPEGVISHPSKQQSPDTFFYINCNAA